MAQVDGVGGGGGGVGRCRGRGGARVLARWGGACGLLGRAGLAVPSDVPGWVCGLDCHAADGVLRQLVLLAQAGDREALLAVLACLRPGLLALAKRAGVALDDVLGEAAVVVLEFPATRRQRVRSAQGAPGRRPIVRGSRCWLPVLLELDELGRAGCRDFARSANLACSGSTAGSGPGSSSCRWRSRVRRCGEGR
jgi:hypothetical protein